MSKAMHLDIQTHRKNPVGVLRRSYREDGKVKKETLGRITGVSLEQLHLIQASLQGKTMMIGDLTITHSREYGASHTLIQLIKSIGLDKVIYSRPSEDWVKLVIGMIVGRILYKGSKLSLTRLPAFSSLWSQLGIEHLAQDVNELYIAMDHLHRRQKTIQKKLAKQHIQHGHLLLYDITSSYLVGDYKDSDLVYFGYNRDKKRGFEQIVIGLMCDQDGCPVGVKVFRGNTSDQSTVEDQLYTVTKQYGIKNLTFIGDRGMIQPDSLESMASLKDDQVTLSSVTALTHANIRKLCEEHQLTNKDHKQFPKALTFHAFPGKRVVLYYNPKRAEEDYQTRRTLIEKTEVLLTEIEQRKRPVTDAKLGIRVGKVINRYKVGKFIDPTIKDGKLNWSLKEDLMEREAQYDGLYAVITDASADDMSKDDVMQNYKRLSKVEQAFRVMKSSLLELRPIYHRTDDRIGSHVFLCMLSYYVHWHMSQRLAPLWQENRTGQDWSYTMDSIIENLKVIQENEVEVRGVTAKQINKPNAEQQRLMDLLLAVEKK